MEDELEERKNEEEGVLSNIFPFLVIGFTVCIIIVIFVSKSKNKIMEFNYEIGLQTVADTNVWANKSDVLVLLDGKESKDYMYSFDNGNSWQSEPLYSVTENGKVGVRVKDSSGNIYDSEAKLNIDNIDNKGPVIETNFPDVYVKKDIDLSEYIEVYDYLSGVKEIIVEPSSLDTSTVGTKIVKITATDYVDNKTELMQTINVKEDPNPVKKTTKKRKKTEIEKKTTTKKKEVVKSETSSVIKILSLDDYSTNILNDKVGSVNISDYVDMSSGLVKSDDSSIINTYEIYKKIVNLYGIDSVLSKEEFEKNQYIIAIVAHNKCDELTGVKNKSVSGNEITLTIGKNEGCCGNIKNNLKFKLYLVPFKKGTVKAVEKINYKYVVESKTVCESESSRTLIEKAKDKTTPIIYERQFVEDEVIITIKEDVSSSEINKFLNEIESKVVSYKDLGEIHLILLNTKESLKTSNDIKNYCDNLKSKYNIIQYCEMNGIIQLNDCSKGPC